MNNPTPRDYGLPHDVFRPKQLETIRWAEATEGVGVMEASTGSGKTAIPAALSHSRSVVALCETKFLQRENYGDTYGADVLFGRSNYRCVHPESVGNCDECLFAEEGMHKCPHANRCLYLLAKARAKASPFASLNYSYWLAARWCAENPPQMVFLDEAHNLPDVITEHAGASVNERQRVEWQLPPFPLIVKSEPSMFAVAEPPDAIARKWLLDARNVLADAYKALTVKAQSDPSARKRLPQCEQLGRKIRNAFDALTRCAEDWYIRSGPFALSFGQVRKPGFVCKPFTARHHFPRLFLDGHATIAMSATIGDPKVFADELGISEYDSRVVPSPFPADARRVHVLDVPKMSRSATPLDFSFQAQAIANAILQCPLDWSGLVHVTRKAEAKLLADRLACLGLQDRIWVMPGWDGQFAPTDQQVAAWNERRWRVPGSICCTWATWQGYNGREERICIVAKTPFGWLGDEFESERMRYSRTMYDRRAAVLMEQALGRTRRGRPEDYDLDGQVNGFVAIADGGWSRVKRHFSAALQEALVVA